RDALTQRVREEGASDGAGRQAARCAHHHLFLVAASLVLLLAAVLRRVLSLGICSAVLRRATVPAAISLGMAAAVTAATITAVGARLVNGPLPLCAPSGGLGVIPSALVVVPLC